MRRGRRKGPQHRPFTAAALFGCALLVFALGAGQLVGLARCEVFARQVEAIDRARAGAPRASLASWSFAFGDGACTVRVPVLESELERASTIDTRAVYGSSGKLREDYIARLVRAQSESAFVGRLADALGAIRDARGLDDDRYLELLVTAVQSIPFGSREARMRLPVEVVESGYGVCSEKSLLLASLMLHEGFDTGFWVLESQNHVAPGIAIEGSGFRGSGYAFIETNRLAYIGEVFQENRAAGPVARPPHLVRLGGTKRYGRADEVAYVLHAMERAERTSAALSSYLERTVAASSKWNASANEATRTRAVTRGLISYLRSQTDEPAAAYAYLTRAADSSTSGLR